MNVACCWKYCVVGESVVGLNIVVCADSIDSKKSMKSAVAFGAAEEAGAADFVGVEVDAVTGFEDFVVAVM